MSVARVLAATLFAVLLAACNSPPPDEHVPPPVERLPPPEFFSEEPAGSLKWTQIAAEPEWVKSPPAREGFLRFAVQGQSDLRSIAASGPRPSAELPIVKAVTAAVAPIAGADAAGRAADVAKTKASLVLRACREERVSMKMVPGNSLCTAWALWEVPLDDVAAAVPAVKRIAARAALRALPTVMSDEK